MSTGCGASWRMTPRHHGSSRRCAAWATWCVCPTPDRGAGVRSPRTRWLPVAQAARVHDLEVLAQDAVQGMKVIVGPAGIGRARDVPGAAVVGEEHAVALQGPQDDA